MENASEGGTCSHSAHPPNASIPDSDFDEFFIDYYNCQDEDSAGLGQSPTETKGRAPPVLGAVAQSGSSLAICKNKSDNGTIPSYVPMGKDKKDGESNTE